MNLRKFGALFLALALTLSLCTVPAAAAESYFLMEDGVLTRYTGPGGAVVIPDGITEIGNDAFYGRTGLTGVTIPDSVTKIGVMAFGDCTGLTSLTIPDSVTKISSRTFSGCTGLTCVTIPAGIAEIGGGAFAGCTGLTGVTIPAGLTKIGGGAFAKTPWLKSLGEFAIVNHILLEYQGTGGAVTIPNTVTAIGDDAFGGCTGLTGITIPDSVTQIGGNAFIGCTGLTSLTIPNTVTAIGDDAFWGCTGLTSFTIPDSVTKIGRSAFSGCTGLTSVTIGDGVTEISYAAFYGCTGLTSITIPKGVTEIGETAFCGCTGLTSVTIPGGITAIGGNAFHGCIGLTGITIPDGVTAIGYGTFEGCTGLTSVTIPGSVTAIGKSAFHDTPWLKSLGEFAVVNHILLKYQGADGAVVIPDGITEIGGFAFAECPRFANIAIPDSVTIIDRYAFSDYIIHTTKPGKDPFDDNLTLYGGAGSYAQTYAKENGVSFVVGKAPAAYAAPQTVLVDGKEVQFTAYALKDADGNMTNYFKVRDVASVLNGTAAQFAVEWDGAVNLNAKTAYTPNGSEMSTPFSGNQPYKQVSGDTLVGGAAQKLSAIVLLDSKRNGYTYYKLRDLGEALGFQVDWNGKNVTISTAKSSGN